MNDGAKIGFYYDYPQLMEKVLSMGIFENWKNDISKITGEPIKICSLKNLNIRFYLHTRYVRLSGSLIKFRHYKTPNKENKHIPPEHFANSTLADLNYTTDYISSLFAIPKTEMKVTGLEFSLTVSTPEKPLFYIDGLNNLHLKPYYYLPPSRNHPQPLEKYCPFTQYNVKCYDWGAWNDIKGNFFRWEIAFKKMQKVKELTGRKQITVADLTETQFQRDMANFALKTLQYTDKQLLIDYSALTPRQREFLFAGENSSYWKMEKKLNQNTAKKKRTDYLRLKTQLTAGVHTPYHHLENLLQSKFDYLISN